MFRSAALGFSIPYPSSSVHLIHEDDELVQFSTLAPDDPKQQSSAGVASSLSFRKQSGISTGDGGEDVTINGERVRVLDQIGAYAEEVNRTYVFLDRDLTATYITEAPHDTLYTKMVLSIRFE